MRRFFSLLLLAFALTVLRAGNAYILVLGVAQDGGYPHIGCKRSCCERAWNGQSEPAFVVSLALVDSANHRWWLFEATPDIRRQLHMFDSLTGHRYPFLPSGIFITHAHTGHYTGLAELGREAMNATSVPVYVLPRMARFLQDNGPWNQLVGLSNIKIHELKADSSVTVSPGYEITPVLVPHRDEYSETCGFEISAPDKKYFFLPDIDKWQRWDQDLAQWLQSTDVAFLDGTFLNPEELPGRNMDEIPHPFIPETLNLISDPTLQNKIYFIHFNHSNVLLQGDGSHNTVQLGAAHAARQWAWY